MSDNITAHGSGIESGLFRSCSPVFQRIGLICKDKRKRDGYRTALSEERAMSLFSTVQPNIVQSIRAFRIPDLAMEAKRLGQHFLYAACSTLQTKAEVFETIVTSFLLPKPAMKNYHSLYDSLTDLIHKAGPQPGFVIVLEGLPATRKFDKEARETLLDVFREAAEFWAERKVNFRVFFSFS